MTEVSFHFNVPDRTLYACRLLRKATRQGAQVVVVGNDDVLGTLDRALWTFEPIEFVPHLRVRPETGVAPRLSRTPVLLAGSALDLRTHHDVLVNLGAEVAAGFESFSRVIEIVPVGEAERLAARGRWKHYAHRGYAIERHEAVA